MPSKNTLRPDRTMVISGLEPGQAYERVTASPCPSTKPLSTRSTSDGGDPIRQAPACPGQDRRPVRGRLRLDPLRRQPTVHQLQGEESLTKKENRRSRYPARHGPRSDPLRRPPAAPHPQGGESEAGERIRFPSSGPGDTPILRG